jgi:cephalosporin-C deacetylase
MSAIEKVHSGQGSGDPAAERPTAAEVSFTLAEAADAAVVPAQARAAGTGGPPVADLADERGEVAALAGAAGGARAAAAGAAVSKAIDVYPYNNHEGGDAYRFAPQLAFLRKHLS